MRLYSKDGVDIWRDIEPDEELQEELEQLQQTKAYLARRILETDRMILRKQAEITLENDRRKRLG